VTGTGLEPFAVWNRRKQQEADGTYAVKTGDGMMLTARKPLWTALPDVPSTDSTGYFPFPSPQMNPSLQEEKRALFAHVSQNAASNNFP
jgi:hypothetical protein